MSKILKSIKISDETKKLLSNPIIPIAMKEEVQEGLSEAEQVAIKLLEEAKKQAEDMINQAKLQAEELILSEKSKVEAWWEEKRAEDYLLIEEAKKQGQIKGYEEGLQLAYQETIEKYQGMIKEGQALIQEGQALIQEGYELKEQIIQDSEKEIIEISIAIAEKIILKELEKHPTEIVNLTKEALKITKEFEKISIFVRPNDFTYIQDSREELLSEIAGEVELMIFPDHSIEKGGCIIKTSNGTLDAKIDTQLEEIRKALVEFSGRRQL